MGNRFETLSANFSQHDRYSVIVPVELVKILQENLKNPYLIYDFCNNMFSEPCMVFGYTMNKKEFILSVQKHLKLDGDGSDLLQIFNYFVMQSNEPMSGLPRKVINILEFLSAIILLANFGENSVIDLHHNAELIEHKINLLLLLFDLRKSESMNISEIIIMLRTSILSLSKVFPSVPFFKNQQILNEIKPVMVNIFQPFLEQQEVEQKVESSKAGSQSMIENFEGEKSQFLGFNKKQSIGRDMGLGGSNLFAPSTGTSIDPSQNQSGPTGMSAQQRHINETLEEKKKRLFKWNTYERVLISLEEIKDQLIRCRSIIKFLSLFSEFDKVTLVWGLNKNMSQGLHIQKDFTHFYTNEEQVEKVVGLSADKAVRELLNLSKKQVKDNDDMLLFQALIQKWQDSLILQRTQNEALQQGLMKAKKQYSRIKIYTKPTIMMSLLNTQSQQIVSNSRMTIVRSPDGNCYSIGKDFRNKMADQDERQFGIPRRLIIQQPVSQIALGKDHAVFLTTDSMLYSMGSNQFGQLGFSPNSSLARKDSEVIKMDTNASNKESASQFEELSENDVAEIAPSKEDPDSYENNIHTFEHPINCEKIEFSPEPVPVQRVVENEQIIQVVAGDNHSMFLTSKGKVYAWGNGNLGQLGVPRRKGQVNQLLSKEGVQFSPKPIFVEELKSSFVEVIISKNNASFAITNKSSIYNWGHLPRGLSLEPKDVVIDLPKKNINMSSYSFKNLTLTKDSALAVGNSVELKFQIPMQEDSEDALTKSGRQRTQDVTIFAIPVFDGHLIANEKDLQNALSEEPDMKVELINDFELPWIEFRGKVYPKYRKTLKLRLNESRDGEDENDNQDQDLDEEDNAADLSDNENAEKDGNDEKEGTDDEQLSPGRSARQISEKKQGEKKKKKKKKKAKYSEEMTKMEKREQETFMFKNRLNVNKPYFRAFINKFNGIAEAESGDEISKPGDSVRDFQEVISADDDEEDLDGEDQDNQLNGKDEEEDESGGDKSEGDDEEDESGEEDSKTPKKKKNKSSKLKEDKDSEVQTPEGQGEENIISSESEEDAVDITALFSNKNGLLVDALQLQKENAYVIPERPEVKKKHSLNRLDCVRIFDSCEALLVNFLAGDYNFFLKKLIGLVSMIPQSLKMLIIPLPKGAQHVDTYQAKLIQKLNSFNEEGGSLIVMFISFESHQHILRNLYKVENSAVVKVKSEISLSAKISESTLIYSWGSASFGKLGNGIVRQSDFDTHSDFVREDLGALVETEEERNSNQYFTYTPQPIVSLLGHKIKEIACGQNHCLALTTDGKLYSWGDNSHYQLGLDPQNLYVAVPVCPQNPHQFNQRNKGEELDGYFMKISEQKASEELDDGKQDFNFENTSVIYAKQPKKTAVYNQKLGFNQGNIFYDDLLGQRPSIFPGSKFTGFQNGSQSRAVDIKSNLTFKQYSNQKLEKGVLRLAYAKVPYFVKTSDNIENQNPATGGSGGHQTSKMSQSGQGQNGCEQNPYELIACGDNNSFAVLSL